MQLHVEMPFFLLIVGIILSDSVTTNLIVYRTCYLTLDFNKTECALLGTGFHDNKTTEMEAKVQPYVSVFKMTKSLMEAFVTSTICFFVGPWSDKYGRRPVLLFTLGGFTVGYIIVTIIGALPNVSPWFLLLSSIPTCLFGGFPALLAATICYITDSTSQRNRGVRLGIFEALLTTGIFLGNVTTSFVFNAYGYLAVYGISTFIIFSSWLAVLVAIPESITNPQTEGKFRNLFKLSLVSETLSATFKRRNGYDRALLLTVISITIIFFLGVTADGDIVFLYLRRKLDWSLRKFTLYNGGRDLAWVFGSVVGGYCLHKLLNIKEGVLLTLGFFSTMSSVLVQGLATKDWHVYVAGGSKCFGGVISPMTRSLVSKLVSAEEYGKVFSFVVITETLVTFIGKPIYTWLYNKTLLTLPGAFNFVTVGIYSVEVLLTIPVIVLQVYRHRVEYQSLSGEDSIN